MPAIFRARHLRHRSFARLRKSKKSLAWLTSEAARLDASRDAGKATGTLTSTGVAPANGETVTINGKVYTFQTVLTNVDGNVLIGANAAAALANLTAAINLGAGAGTTYATAMTLHPTVSATNPTGTTVVLTAKSGGTAGNALTTTETSTVLSFDGATLSGGTATSGSNVFDKLKAKPAETVAVATDIDSL